MSHPSSAFADEPRLSKAIEDAVSADQRLASLLADISAYVLRLKSEITGLHHRIDAAPSADPSEPPLKKRKAVADLGTAGNEAAVDGAGTSWTGAGAAECTVADVSVSVPVRKKMRLEFMGDTGKGDGGIRAINASSGDIEAGLAWRDVEQVVAVAVPERAQLTYNFLVIPGASCGAPSPSSHAPDALVWTVPEKGAPKNMAVAAAAGGAVEIEDKWLTSLSRIINQELRPHGRSLVQPSATEFISGIVQAHRKEDKSFHVKAFKGSKDGFLYFLGPGILFGFRKPILFFPHSSISSISYTSILARTFNLVVSAYPAPQGQGNKQTEQVDTEFSMLDQADFAGIDAYVKRHGLNDASLAAGRRARHYNVNKESAAERQANGDGEHGDGGGGELAKAEQALQDEEDEVEEDFDPGSGGESDGSGSDSEEEGGEDVGEVGAEEDQ